MKKSARKKNALLLAAVVSGLAFAQPVDAANLAAIVASNYGASQMGAVQGSLINSDDISVSAGILTDLNGDAGIYNMIDPVTGKSEMYLRQYGYSTTNLVPSYAFGAQSDWKSDVASGTISNAANAHGVARYNDYLYIASYDEGTIGVGQVSGDAIIDKPAFTVNIKQDLEKFEGIQFEDKCTLPGEAVMVDGDKLYVMANVNPEGTYWSYNESYLMQYIIKENGSLSYNGAVQMGKNTDSVRLNKYNNMIITNAIGGPQNFGDDVANEDTSLNIAFIDPTTGNLTSSKKVTVPEGVTREMRSIKILPNGAAYVMCYNIAQYGEALNVDVYHTTVANLASDTPADWTKIYSETGAAGWFANLNAEYDTNRVWMEVGDKILVFTDGATTPKVFQIKDFSTNEAYSSANMWTLIETDNVAGDLAKLRADNAAVTNTELLWKDSATQTDPITADVNFDDNVTISVSDSAYANLTNNILAGVSGNYTMVTGKDINIQVENDTATPVGIYAGPGEPDGEYADLVTVTADKINIITKSPKNGNSLTNAIWVDPSATQVGLNQTLMRLTGDVNIRMEGGMGGNGIAIAKTDRWGEKSTEAIGEAKLEIYGDVSIKGETNQEWGIGVRKDNVLSRFNNAGIVTKVDNSSVLVVGDVDLDVYGNGIATVADNSKITIARGGQISVPKGTKYGYYALASYGGDVSMNLGQNGNTVGNSDVNIDGDIFVVKKEKPFDASVSLALVTANSHLSGIIDNGSTANLYLQNGATWTNEANNTRYEQDNEDIGFGEKSRVTNFYGGSSTAKAGIINQTKNSKALLIDNYSGHTYINYEHDTQTPTTIFGGSTHVTSAQEDSSITLRTDSSGINVSADDTVNAVLNALANKLYYTNYTTGENNLDGYVQIAEGLTTSSVAKKTGNIAFDSTNGRGSLDGYTGGDLTDPDPTPTPPVVDPDPEPTPPVVDPEPPVNPNPPVNPEPPSVIPDSQDRDSFTTAIRGNDTHDRVYYEAGVLKNGVYNFTKENTTITSQAGDDDVPAGPWVSGTIAGAIEAYADGESDKHIINIDMHGNKLTIDAKSTGITAITNGVINVNNAGDMDITADGGSSVAAALHTSGGGEIHIHNGDGGVLKLRAKSTSNNGSVVKSKNGATGESKIIIDGMVDIVADGAEGATTGVSAVASRVEIGGGNIEATNGATAALWAYGEFVTENAGIINLNVKKDAEGNVIGAGDRKTTIKGEIATSGNMNSKAEVSVGLNTADSFWEGNYADCWGYGVAPYREGKMNLWIDKGAYWKGFTSGVMNVDLRGANSYWQGFASTDGMNLTIADGAVWKNALSATQVDSKGNQVEAMFDSFTGDGAYIDMTGETIINVDAGLLNKETMLGQATPTTETANGITGNVSIDNYSGNTTVIYKHLVNDGAVSIIGGDIKIKSAADNSEITLRTDSDRIDTSDQLAVNSTLNSLAKKLYYQNYMTGERNLTGYVQIAEGLTTGSIARKVGDVAFSEMTGQGSLKTEFTSAITGNTTSDAEYVDNSVVQADGVYNFTSGLTTTNTAGADINGINAGISSAGEGEETVVNMNSNELNLNVTNEGNTAGIAAINGTVTVNNANNMTINAQGSEANAILADGGTVQIDNESKGTIKLDASGDNSNTSAVIKTTNGGNVAIGGLVDIKADGNKGVADAVLVEDGTVTIGGGTIKATNGANAITVGGGMNTVAIAGDMNVIDGNGGTANAGAVYINLTEDLESLGNKTNITGDIQVGATGEVYIGLSTEDSSWNGDYAAGSGIFDLYMENGAEWNGNSAGDNMSLYLESGATWTGNNTGNGMFVDLAADTEWNGYNTGDNMSLNITNATWNGYNTGDSLNLAMENAIWNNTLNTSAQNKVSSLAATSSILNMTADNASDVVIDSYRGDMTVFYNHEVTDGTTNILGGDITIKSASTGSQITLITDRKDISLNDYYMASAALNALANKLYYTNYKNGENNLKGYVKIAEGLTTASEVKAFGDIKFSTSDGQGSLDADTIGGVLPDHQIKDNFEDPIRGNETTDRVYVASGVLRDGVYEFDSENTKIEVEDANLVYGFGTTIGSAISSYGTGNKTMIDLNGNNLTVNTVTSGRNTGFTVLNHGEIVLDNVGDLDISVKGVNNMTADGFSTSTNPSAAIHSSYGNVTIHNGDGGVVKMRVETTGSAKDSKLIYAEAGNVTIDGMVDMVADYEKGVTHAIHAYGGSNVEIGGGNIEATNGAEAAIYAEANWMYGGVGTVNVNVAKDEAGTVVGAGDRKTTITGNFIAKNGAAINVGLNGSESYWKGNYTKPSGWYVTGGNINLWLTNGAHWKGYTNDAVDLKLSGMGSYWNGFGVGGAMKLTLKDGAVWQNAITADQGEDSAIGTFVGDGGYIDMTGAKVFTTSSLTEANGATITDSTDGITGNLVFDNYSGNTTVIYKKEMIDGVKGNLTKYANILGGTTTIKSAAEGSSITLRTDSDYIDLTSRAMVEDTLNSLANKLYYTGYVGEEGAAGERNLAGYVELAEGLTTAGVKKAYGDIGFSETDGQGSLKGHASGIVAADTQDKTSFDTPIRGEDEIEYIDHGVLKDDVYTFTKDTTITVNNAMIPGGMWLGNIGSAISASGDGKTTTLDLQGKQFTVNTTNQGASTGLTAINKGILVVDNAKDMNITATGTDVTAALFANSGGEIHIKNGDGGVLTARAHAGNASNGAVIKTMNGVSGVESKILIDGMVDVVADAEDGANEAISAVASSIEIGGGNIEAKNGAWAAIRAYGEFVSTNKGIVNVNILKDASGNIIGAGDRKTTITGDFVTNGGMGTRGQISVGLNGRDSFWEGNYGDNVGYGSTPGQLGNVNLFVKNGAHWKGFSNGSVSLDLSGAGSYWYGFSTSEKMLLKLTDGAVWQNAITAEQTDSSGNIVDSHVGTFIGDGGYIDMTGAKVFTASSNSLNGTTTSGQSSFIEESTDGITGNLVIDNYSGNTTVIYRNQLVTDGIQTLALDDEGTTTVAPRVEIIGGNITINSAAENSSITLRTDNVNIDTEDHDLVRDTLNSLANRLFYTSYADGERNLQGYVQIAEGLVTSSAALQIGEIMYDADADGQGSVNADTIRDNIEEPDQPTPDQPSGDDSSGGVIYGDSETAMMRGAKSAMASTAMMWRAENDDMMKRLGEIRNGNGEAGIWAKYYTGKSEMNAQKAKYKTDYTAYQLGYDKQIGEWLIGAAFSYNDGESSYQLGGKGDNSVTSLSLYGTKKASNGTYLDLVAKVGRLDTDFTVYNDMFHKLTGDYDTWGMSASAEYGKRFEQSNGFYIDPSVQLTIGRIQGKDYTAASDFLDAQGRYKNMYVHQDSMNSIVGKLGIGIGQKTDRANYFAKFALAHEFGGDFDTNFQADGEAGGKTNIDFGGTWCELEIGGGIQLNDTTMLYATYERSFSGDVKEKYRIDGGVRFSF